VQNARKEAGLAVTDRIRLTVHGPARLKEAWDRFGATVAAETLAAETAWAALDGQLTIEAGDDAWLVKIERTGHNAP
jgi:isoleucyl-tRNA synthetase